MKKYLLIIMVFMANGITLFAQEGEHGEHSVPFNKPEAWVANLVVWVSVLIVIATLLLTLKYLFKPGEDNPNHIKNIVLDERI